MSMNPVPQLTPSEIAMLNANPEGGNVLFGNLMRELENTKGSSQPLLERVLNAALRANEVVGVFEYRPSTQRAFLGLRPRTRLVADITGTVFAWPEPSLEASLIQLYEDLSRQCEPVTVAALVKKWLSTAAVGHLQAAIEWFYGCLATRGWVRQESSERLHLFQFKQYVIPESTCRLLNRTPWWDPMMVASQESAHRFDCAEILRREVRRALCSLNSPS